MYTYGDSNVEKNKGKDAYNKSPLGKMYVCSHSGTVAAAFARNANVTFRARLISNSITERTLHYVDRILQRDRVPRTGAFIASRKTLESELGNRSNAFQHIHVHSDDVRTAICRTSRDTLYSGTNTWVSLNLK